VPGKSKNMAPKPKVRLVTPSARSQDSASLYGNGMILRGFRATKTYFI